MSIKIIGGTPINTDKKMRDRDPDDFYETDPVCISAYLQKYPLPGLRDQAYILDPGSGTGSYGKVLRSIYPEAVIVGIEQNEQRFPIIPDGYTWLGYGDFLTFDECHNMFDAVVGNPPYKLAEEFFWKSVRCLRNGTGTIDFLLRLAFLESDRRYKRMFTVGYAPTQVTVLSTRPSFTGDGKTYPTAFAFFRWEFQNGACNDDSRVRHITYDRKLLTK